MNWLVLVVPKAGLFRKAEKSIWVYEKKSSVSSCAKGRYHQLLNSHWWPTKGPIKQYVQAPLNSLQDQSDKLVETSNLVLGKTPLYRKSNLSHSWEWKRTSITAYEKLLSAKLQTCHMWNISFISIFLNSCAWTRWQFKYHHCYPDMPGKTELFASLQ